jgi:hypothetical protein
VGLRIIARVDVQDPLEAELLAELAPDGYDTRRDFLSKLGMRP